MSVCLCSVDGGGGAAGAEQPQYVLEKHNSSRSDPCVFMRTVGQVLRVHGSVSTTAQVHSYLVH